MYNTHTKKKILSFPQYLSESCPAKKEPHRMPTKKMVVVNGFFHWSLHTRSN